jgi:hypothetical protein
MGGQAQLRWVAPDGKVFARAINLDGPQEVVESRILNMIESLKLRIHNYPKPIEQWQPIGVSA